MTLISDLITEIRTNIDEPTSITEKFFSDAEIINYVKRSINDICIDTDSNYNVYNLTVTGSTVGTITSINCSTTINITLANHGLVTRDAVYISGITGTVSSILDTKYFETTYVDANNFTISVDGSSYAYTTGGNLIKMPQTYTFASFINTGESVVDLRYLAYRSTDWAEWLYDDLVRVDPKTNKSYTNSQIRRYTCIVYGNAIQLNKYPKIGDMMVLAGRIAPNAITATTSTYPLGIIEEDASIKYATSMCWLKKNMKDIAGEWYSLYADRKKTIELKRKKMVQFNYPSALSIFKVVDRLTDSIYAYPGEIVV